MTLNSYSVQGNKLTTVAISAFPSTSAGARQKKSIHHCFSTKQWKCVDCNIFDKRPSSVVHLYVQFSYTSWRCSKHPLRNRPCTGWCIWRSICGCLLPGSTAASQSFPSCLLLEPHRGLQGDLTPREFKLGCPLGAWSDHGFRLVHVKIIRMNIFTRKRPGSKVFILKRWKQ